jgi:aryl-alcohol dehydrogenase-like predicted oxidoreductase
MEHRRLVATGFTIPILSFGPGTFGSKGPRFRAWDKTSVTEAGPLVDIRREAAATTFDAALTTA